MQQIRMEISLQNLQGISVLILGLFSTMQFGLSDVDLCEGFDCGKGTCKTSSVFPFVNCECQYGWKRPEGALTIPFLPCVMPNCTFDYNCGEKAPSPAPSLGCNNTIHPDPLNPCDWNVCGVGKCVITSNYAYACQCNQGYGNLMNWTNGYCVSECQIGANCKALGVSVRGNSTVQIWQNTSSPADGISPASYSADVSESSGGGKLVEDIITRFSVWGLLIISMHWM